MKDTTDTNPDPTIDCQSLENFIIDFIDDNLPAREKMLFIKHIEECEHCDDYLKSYRKTIDLSKAALTDKKSDEKADIPEKMVEAILAATRKT